MASILSREHHVIGGDTINKEGCFSACAFCFAACASRSCTFRASARCLRSSAAFCLAAAAACLRSSLSLRFWSAASVRFCFAASFRFCSAVSFPASAGLWHHASDDNLFSLIAFSQAFFDKRLPFQQPIYQWFAPRGGYSAPPNFLKIAFPAPAASGCALIHFSCSVLSCCS